MDNNRYRAIQTLTQLSCPDDEADLDRNAELVATSLVALGVSPDEIRAAMTFAIMTAWTPEEGEDD